MLRKLIPVISLVILLACLIGCQGNIIEAADPVGWLIDNDQLANSHKKRLLEKETPYTLVSENDDGSVSLYIFPIPHRLL